MVPLTGTVPRLVAVKPGIFPVPVAASPITVLLLVQEKVVPAPTGLETTVTGTPALLQKTWLATGSTAGVGKTVMI